MGVETLSLGLIQLQHLLSEATLVGLVCSMLCATVMDKANVVSREPIIIFWQHLFIFSSSVDNL